MAWRQPRTPLSSGHLLSRTRTPAFSQGLQKGFGCGKAWTTCGDSSPNPNKLFPDRFHSSSWWLSHLSPPFLPVQSLVLCPVLEPAKDGLEPVFTPLAFRANGAETQIERPPDNPVTNQPDEGPTWWGAPVVDSEMQTRQRPISTGSSYLGDHCTWSCYCHPDLCSLLKSNSELILPPEGAEADGEPLRCLR